MDEWADRGILLANTEGMLEYNHQENTQNQNQISLFGGASGIANIEFKMKDGEKASQKDKLFWEKELLGLYISGHPLDRVREKIEAKNITIQKIKEQFGNGMEVTIAGIIETVRQVITKKNERMAFLKISDFTGSIDAVVFPSLFTTHTEIFVPEKCIAFSGKISLKDNEKSIIIEKVKEI